jgi:ABC-type multidrug transport system fused ATPase/permease subunit
LSAPVGPLRDPGRRGAFLRLLAYARPYGLVLLGAILCAGVFAGARTARLVVLRPLLEEIRIQRRRERGPRRHLRRGRGEVKPADGPDADATQSVLSAVQKHWRRFALALVLTLLVVPPAHFGQEYLSQYVLGRVLVDLQRDLCGKLLSLPLSFHQHTSRGETLSRILNDTAKAHTALDQFFVDVV